MGIPKPITFTAAGEDYDGPAPEAFVVVGDGLGIADLAARIQALEDAAV